MTYSDYIGWSNTETNDNPFIEGPVKIETING